MTAIDVFKYAGQQVRTVIIDGEPWFVIADVAAVLGLTNPTMVANSMFPDDLSSAEVIDSMGRTQTARTVNEPGLYRMIFQSRKAEAADFQRWVTREVLPQIRRTGQFVQVEIEHQLPASFADALRQLAETVEQREALEAKVHADAPKVDAFDRWMDADGYYSMDAVAKILRASGRNILYRDLRNAGVIMTGSTRPYQRYAHHFALVPGTKNGHAYETTKVLPSGVTFIAKTLGITEEVTA